MIEFENVSLRLGLFALKEITLQIPDGEYYFIIGPSGAGKTVILEAIAGLHKPQTGRVLVRGEDVTLKPPEKRRIALVYQDYSLFPHMTVSENIAFGLRLQGIPKNEIKERVDAIIQKYNIKHLKDRHPATLSGGEQQRIAIARSLAVTPDILLLDEPLSALDPLTKEIFIEELRKIHQENNLTIVQVTHGRGEARRLATRIAVIIDGRLIEEDCADIILNTPRTKEVANFVGIENLVDGIVETNEGGLTSTMVAGQTIETISEAKPGEEVCLCIHAEDIVISLLPEQQFSARNVIPGIITRLSPNGPLVKVMVDCGVEMTALLTKRSVEELDLRPGKDVFLAIKASAIHTIRSPESKFTSSGNGS